MNIPPDHPQRRKTDPEVTLYSSRVRLGTRPVDFTRPMSVADRQRQAEREAALARVNAAKPSRLRKRVSDGYLILGFCLAGLAGIVGVVALAWWLQ